MKLIVGLGNPGRKYQGTRHNVGFDVVHALAGKASFGGQPHWRTKFKGEYCELNVGSEPVILLLPFTYMNLSGESVQPAAVFFKIDPGDVLVICDDINLPLARLRFRQRGSAGGQKGLADILRKLSTQEVPRLRVGVGAAPPQWDVADYVLSKFQPDEQVLMEEAVAKAARGAIEWAEHGTSHCMNSFNGKNAGGQKQVKRDKKTQENKSQHNRTKNKTDRDER